MNFRDAYDGLFVINTGKTVVNMYGNGLPLFAS
jgi:hypothetical protein